MGIIRNIRRLGREENGVAAVEFAMIAPVFISLILVVIDVGRYMWTLNSMQYAIDEAIRAGVVRELSDDEIEQRAKDALIVAGASSIIVEVISDSETVTVTADMTYQFLFPLSSFVDSAPISLRSEMPL
jgi:Flp pilus assembly protein TadG